LGDEVQHVKVVDRGVEVARAAAAEDHDGPDGGVSAKIPKIGAGTV
jgi:hypothetical protein